MKKYLPALALSALLLSTPAPFAYAQSPVEITVSSPTSELITEANQLLSHGKKLGKAISFYQEAVRREPKNAAFQTFLACAHAGRAFAMARYLRERYSFQGRIEERAELIKDLEQGQRDKAHPLYGLTAPSTLKPLQWPDDEMDKGDVSIKMVDAAAKSFAEVQKASRMVSQPDYIAPDKNELMTLQGWAALLLYVGPYRFVDAPEKEKTYRLMESVLRQTLQNPKDTRQTQRVADAFVIAYSYPVIVPSEHFVNDKELYKEGIDLSLVAAPKARNKGAAWYWIATNQANRQHNTPSDKAAAINSYNKAVQYDPSNALYHYALASALIEQKQINYHDVSHSPGSEEILQQIRKGNASVSVGVAQYEIAAPTLLRWPFIPYPFNEFSENAVLLNMMRTLQYEKVKAGKQDEALALVMDLVKCANTYLKATNASSLTEEQRERYFTAGKMFLMSAGAGVVYMKLGGQTVPQDLDYTVSFVPERRRYGVKVAP